ncbi:hypothetical protein GCWU000325_00635 [Alloprevotella tannerae ATCC 51259]|uniref:Uncharacterized protein n=1 Tax=Alloprevotella tannerae ATCC 51259 TaxID=626522 RepID=C9LEK5_9BACT|nr:hypothetical protein GCWU000325_00635 [Alloprevotella tannerae ATCC 51259]
MRRRWFETLGGRPTAAKVKCARRYRNAAFSCSNGPHRRLKRPAER